MWTLNLSLGYMTLTRYCLELQEAEESTVFL